MVTHQTEKDHTPKTILAVSLHDQEFAAPEVVFHLPQKQRQQERPGQHNEQLQEPAFNLPAATASHSLPASHRQQQPQFQHFPIYQGEFVQPDFSGPLGAFQGTPSPTNPQGFDTAFGGGAPPSIHLGATHLGNQAQHQGFNHQVEPQQQIFSLAPGVAHQESVDGRPVTAQQQHGKSHFKPSTLSKKRVWVL